MDEVVSLHNKYLETSRKAKARWAAANKDRINARRRERRLQKIKERLGNSKCLNCEVVLAERLNWDPGRSKLYCRKCLTEYKDEARRHRWRRYYHRKKGTTRNIKEGDTKPTSGRK